MAALAVKADVFSEVVSMYNFDIQNPSLAMIVLLSITSVGLTILGLSSARSDRPIWARLFWSTMFFMIILSATSIYIWTSSWIALAPLVPATIFIMIFFTLKRTKR